MATPLDPYFEAFQSDPLTGIVILAMGALVLVGPEILVAALYLRPMLARKVRRDVREGLLLDVEEGLLDPAIERATSGVREDVKALKDLVKADELQSQIGVVQARLEELDKNLESRLEGLSVEDLKEDVERVKVTLEELDVALGTNMKVLHEGIEGLPARLRGSLDGSAGAEMKQVLKAATAAEETAIEYYEAEMSPADRLASRIDQMEPSEDYQKKHPIGASIIAGVKELVAEQVRARAGSIKMKRVGSGSRGSEFGG